ncbi:hypothetical protein [Paraferrimonas sedimenticola]|uniref:Uncharacterized protein n=1 Tax=Paraferrimonas sedimenticola TaxID=375674 RepID=A0AA37RSW1_9GAMM|nr:hypothetical protein [Paraferrimonas sedimenticola]GLP94716.1 hypothetical protein GCM10007895_00220 [Paraferrimonas sedimenticola]
MWWRYLIIVLAYVLLAAHFLRYGNLAVVIVSAVAPLLYFVKAQWSDRVIQLGLIAAIMVWLQTSWQLISMRIAFDSDYTRLAIIMAAVVGFNLLALVLTQQIYNRRTRN